MKIDSTSLDRRQLSANAYATMHQANTSKFSAVLSKALVGGKAELVSGRLGLDLDKRGQPAKIIYFDESGQKLTASTFSAENILKYTQKYGIDLNDLTGLGVQLDAAGIGYRPYELYQGTGSDHGVDFADLVAGGLGTAFDWRQDANATLKGPSAPQALADSQSQADSLGLELHAAVTQNLGIDPSLFQPLSSGSIDSPRTEVMFNGFIAAWYRSAAEAASAARLYQGRTIALNLTRAAGLTLETQPLTLSSTQSGQTAAENNQGGA